MTWICLRCLEKVKHILPNGGEKMMMHPMVQSVENHIKQIQVRHE